MAWLHRFAMGVWLVAGCPGPVLSAAAGASVDPRALAEDYFRQLHGFDALEAYVSRRGRARTAFGLARRWSAGRAELLIDIQTPRSFRKWALLLRHNLRRSDDLFVYVPQWRRVRRLTALQIEAEVIFQLLPLGDLRPIAPGELEYRLLGEASVEGRSCQLVEGRPTHAGLAFDRLELVISPESGLALRTRYFRGARELRRILVSPADIREYDGRKLPVRRRIVTPPDGGTTVLSLVNLMAEPELPANLFTSQNLRVQRFPGF
ncbi:MAG: outer membrane lipoprotein-sorting protein [Myxococcota bacterium]